MKILSWNVRDLGKTEKRRMARRLVKARNVDLLLIQESKMVRKEHQESQFHLGAQSSKMGDE